MNRSTRLSNQLRSSDIPLTAGEINLIVATKEKEKSRAFQSQQVSLSKPGGLTYVTRLMLLVFIICLFVFNPPQKNPYSTVFFSDPNFWTFNSSYFSVDCSKHFHIELFYAFKSLSPESVTQLDAKLILHLNYVQILPAQ